MSKRHQSSRRKSYGRRQHEVHERAARRDREPFEPFPEVEVDPPRLDDATAFAYGGSGRLGISLAD